MTKEGKSFSRSKETGDDRESHPLAPSAPRGSEQGSGGSKQGMALGPILKPEVPFHGQAKVLQLAFLANDNNRERPGGGEGEGRGKKDGGGKNRKKGSTLSLSFPIAKVMHLLLASALK